MNKKLSMSELARMSQEDFKQSNKLPVILVLDNIRSGLNVGSIFRSGDAFRVEKIICCGFTPVPPHREVLKSALGATETVEWSYAESAFVAISDLKAAGVACFAIEQTEASLDLKDFRLSEATKTAIVLGNEVTGVDQNVIDLCHGAIEIAQHGTKHSLNVAVCAGIVLFSISNT